MWVPGAEGASGATDYPRSMEARERARGMQHVSVGPPLLESFVDCSKSIVIDCSRCGEKLLLLGRESDWATEGRTAFECGGCGKKLSLKHRH